MNEVDITVVRDFFLHLQSEIVDQFESLDQQGRFSGQEIRLGDTGISRPRVLTSGRLFEKAAVLCTYSVGDSLPPAATERQRNLAGASFSATSISTIVHPWNPNVPTTHMNLRMFCVNVKPQVWYTGGGMDLTPYLPHVEDFQLWHENARSACNSEEQYSTFKKQCDEYFYLPHRGETRGIGGLFFDDYVGSDFPSTVELVKQVGQTFLRSYSTIVRRRQELKWTPEDEEWMLVRRGRYAEFNLAIDRGTKYGMQSGRRIESVLASLPPRAKWIYEHRPATGSTHDQMLSFFQPKLNWISTVDKSVDYSGAND